MTVVTIRINSYYNKLLRRYATLSKNENVIKYTNSIFLIFNNYAIFYKNVY